MQTRKFYARGTIKYDRELQAFSISNMNLILLLLRNPIKTLRFFYTWLVQSTLLGLRRVLLPHVPMYQPFRIQLHRAYLSSCITTFPDLVYRLPIGQVPESRAKIIQSDFLGYVIPGSKSSLLSLIAQKPSNSQCVVLYAHGGGYARGEAKMYLTYMERWAKGAAAEGLELVFLSVEYRECSSRKLWMNANQSTSFDRSSFSSSTKRCLLKRI